MRIGIVSQGVTDQSLLGGPGQVAARHAIGLANRGHQVRVLTTDLIRKGARATHPTFGIAEHEGVEVRCLPGHSASRWPGSVGPVFVPRLRRALQDIVTWADVVHAHEWPTPLTQAARRLAHSSGTACFVQPHGTIIERRGAGRVLHATYNRFHRPLPDEVYIVGSRDESRNIESVFDRGIAVQSLVNPSPRPTIREDADAVRSRREAWGFPSDSKIILYAHRLTPNKGLDLAIGALSTLPESYCLAVVGEDRGFPSFTEQCHALANDLNLSARVGFFGPVSQSEIDEIVLAADIFLLPARFDTFPLMVLHALGCGRPVVLTRTCQCVESLGHATVVADPEPNSLSTAIASLTPAKTSELTATGKALIASEYSEAAVAGRLTDIYLDRLSRLHPSSQSPSSHD